jgi:CheY-like chemotaxis protein
LDGSLGRHALIIEDEMIIALEVENLLQQLGFQTFDIADNPSDALAYAQARRPDLVTADMRIVGGTGAEAVAEIVRIIGKVPVVYVTGNPDMLAPYQPVFFVDKPIAPNRFAEACELACGHV